MQNLALFVAKDDVTPGQAAVFYYAEAVVGGGWIA